MSTARLHARQFITRFNYLTSGVGKNVRHFFSPASGAQKTTPAGPMRSAASYIPNCLAIPDKRLVRSSTCCCVMLTFSTKVLFLASTLMVSRYALMPII